MLRTEVRRTLGSLGLSEGSTVLIAVSGGVDSSVLAHATVTCAPDLGLRVRLAHFNHRIRAPEEHARDRTAVSRLADQLAVDLLYGEAAANEIAAAATRSGEGLEAAARARRYAFLLDSARAAGAQAVAVGHTADDQLETLLFRLFTGRGASITGLRAMEPVRPFDSHNPHLLLTRPLLHISREAVLQYAREHRLSFQVDSTNLSTQHARGALRAEVIPSIDRSFPNWRGALRSLQERQQLLGDAILSAAAALEWAPGSGTVACGTGRFLALDGGTRLAALHLACRQLGAPPLPFRHLAPLVHARRAIELPSAVSGHGIHICIDTNEIRVAVEEPDRRYREFAAELSEDHPVTLPGGAVVRTASASPDPGNVVHLSGVRPPLIVRSRRPGDRVRRRMGSRSVKDVLSAMRLDPALRRWVPVIEDRDGVVAVLASVVGGSDVVADRADEAAGVRISIG